MAGEALATDGTMTEEMDGRTRSAAAIAQFIATLQHQGIEYVRFEMPDLHGIARSKLVSMAGVENAARRGLNFYSGTLALDTSSHLVSGSGYHAEHKYRDCLLFPDLDSVTPVPWLQRTVKVMGDPYWSKDNPLTVAPRNVLKSLLAKTAELGFDVKMSHEFSFYLLTPEHHAPLFTGSPLFSTAPNPDTPVLERLLTDLQAAGVALISHHCSATTSQFAIHLGTASGLRAADQAFTCKTTIQEVAHRLGYLATFMSKPFADQPGCGSHLQLSLWHRDSGGNAFLEPSREDGLSAIAQSFIQGILDHAPALMPLVSPTPNCYRRLKPHSFAPSNISWGIEDRSALVRVKATHDEETHLELRAASGLSNPYLVAAATLAAGLLGLRRQRSLQPMSDGPSEDDHSLPHLPPTLENALVALAADADLQEMLGSELCQLFTTIKQFELSRFHDEITDWERREYLQLYSASR